MDLENIVQQILLNRRDLTREEVLKKIYEKKRSAEDYFLDEVAARIVAVELGVEVQGENEAFNGEIKTKDLVSGLNESQSPDESSPFIQSKLSPATTPHKAK